MSPEYDEHGNRRKPRKKKPNSGKRSSSGKKRNKRRKQADNNGLVIGGAIVGVLLLIGIGGFLIVQSLNNNGGGVGADSVASSADDYSGANEKEQLEQRNAWRNPLKNMGFVVHNYHDKHSAFPASIPIETGSMPQSWMTHLLPFVQQPSLFNRVDKNANWNAPVNAEIFQTVVPPYMIAATGKEALANGYAVTHFSANSNLFTDDEPMRLRDIIDGTSNTIMLGSIGSNIPAWGDPANSRDPANGIGLGPNQFGAGDGTFAMVTMCDGRSVDISVDVDPLILKAISTPAGGEVVEAF